MKLKAYEYLFLVNKGFDEVTRNLRALARYPALRPVEIAQFAQLAETRLTFLAGPLVWNKLVSPVVNCHPKVQKYYELTFLSRLFPADNIIVRLIK